MIIHIDRASYKFDDHEEAHEVWVETDPLLQHTLRMITTISYHEDAMRFSCRIYIRSLAYESNIWYELATGRAIVSCDDFYGRIKVMRTADAPRFANGGV